MSDNKLDETSFGEWLRQRRHILDLTQQELADQAGCARITLRRIEAGALKPSKELASILLEKLGTPEAEREAWLRFARGLSGIPDNRVSDSVAGKPFTNLPVALTSFIGREKEQAEVRHLIVKNRLVTLTGAGGSGKTRLAMQVATELADPYQYSVWWVELAALNDSTLVPPTVMKVIGLAEQPGRTATDSLIDYFQSKHALLILDNCEHLIESCAQLVMRLLKTCQELTILATSREVLNVDGEIAWIVPSLQAPDLSTQEPIAQLQEYDAVRLFIERVKASEQDFQLTDQNAHAVVNICQQLAGIPLAIELAAARVKVLSVEQIAARLEDALKLLTEGKRTAPQRQQTLRATMDWSYDLLTEKEQVLFKRLSVFAGGFTLEAAEAVCTGDGISPVEVLNLLKYLVDKSLVVKQVQGIEARYRLLEPIRQYANDRLFHTDDREAMYVQHLTYFLTLVEDAEPELRGPKQVEWFQRLEQEHDELRAALGWALKRGTGEVVLRLCVALARFWRTRGYLTEGREWLQQALGAGRRQLNAAFDMTAVYAHALNWASDLAIRQDDFGLGRGFAEEGLVLFRELGDKHGIAFSLDNLGRVALSQDEDAVAWKLFEESLIIQRGLGNKWGIAASLDNLGHVALTQSDYVLAQSLFEESLTLWHELSYPQGLANSLNVLGRVAQNQGNYAVAQTHFEKSLTLWRKLGHKRGSANSYGSLGLIALTQGDYTAARRYFDESLTLSREVGSKRNIAHILIGEASLAFLSKESKRATKLLAAATVLLGTIHTSLDEPERTMYDNTITILRGQPDEATFAAAWAEGKAMSIEQAISFALQED